MPDNGQVCRIMGKYARCHSCLAKFYWQYIRSAVASTCISRHRKSRYNEMNYMYLKAKSPSTGGVSGYIQSDMVSILMSFFE